MNLLHQASYWGHMASVEALLKEFGADPEELTAEDGTGRNAAAVAEAAGHGDVAALLRQAVAAKTASWRCAACTFDNVGLLRYSGYLKAVWPDFWGVYF